MPGACGDSLAGLIDKEVSCATLEFGGITLIIGDIGGGKARIKIEAPREILVLREELVG